MSLCKCSHCLKEVSDDKSVSKSTFHHHNHHIKKFSHIDTYFKICHCSCYSTDHCFQSQSIYYEHHQSQSYQHKDISDNTNCNNSSATSSLSSSTFNFNSIFNFNNCEDNIDQLIENNLNYDDDNVIHQT